MNKIVFNDILNFAREIIDRKADIHENEHDWLAKLIFKSVIAGDFKDLSVGVTRPVDGKLTVAFTVNLGDRFDPRSEFIKERRYINSLLVDADVQLIRLSEEENNCTQLRVQIISNPTKELSAAVRA